MKRVRIQLFGRVQGVGCRPYVYRLAERLGLSGFVRNDAAGVYIEVQGKDADAAEFEQTLRRGDAADWPALMAVSDCRVLELPIAPAETGFEIIASNAQGNPSAGVTPDMGVCAACLAELRDPADFRYHYPFITCTHCGPRYSIIKTIPYDRPNTTMNEFTLCPQCRQQYENPRDRRFHAQPVACPACGPKVWLADAAGQVIENDSDKAISAAAVGLREGKIVAVKGIGGFHLAVDALNEAAVVRLRQRKRRQAKPFAMMARDVDGVRRYAAVDAAAEKWLTCPQRPIVLADKLPDAAIAASVAPGTNRFGFMLCYAPLHYLLFDQPGVSVLVMTSANFSEEPLICDNTQAIDELGETADFFLMHDRVIYRQTDDSVVQIVDGEAAFLRRARGFVPEPLRTKTPAAKTIFAAGADLKNTFCFVKGDQYLLSEHIGDLAEGRAYRHYVRSVEHFSRLFEATPEAVVCDLHPGYLSSQFAEGLGVAPVIRVQHHWAHAAATMAECGFDGTAIGLVADGTGYGTDGAVWGCECLIASLTEFGRFGHLAYFPLAGGDRAAHEAMRPLAGLLSPQGRFDRLAEWMDVLSRIEPDADAWRWVCMQIEKGVNVVPTSSLGRLFDAAAALCGCGTHNRFEAELPMALEAMTLADEDETYPVVFDQQADEVWRWRVEPLMAAMIDDLRAGTEAAVIATRFHNTVCAALLGFAQRARAATGLTTAALSGGVFCNRYIARRLIKMLKGDGFEVLWKRRVPANDGGIALGQAAIAAKILSTKC